MLSTNSFAIGLHSGYVDLKYRNSGGYVKALPVDGQSLQLRVCLQNSCRRSRKAQACDLGTGLYSTERPNSKTSTWIDRRNQGPVKALIRVLHRFARVVMVDEFRTSRVCSTALLSGDRCESRLRPFRFAGVDGPRQPYPLQICPDCAMVSLHN